MSTVTAIIDAQLLKLSAEQRLELISRIWDSLSDAELPAPTQAQIDELRRRRKLMQDDPSRAIPFEESMRRVEREVQRLSKNVATNAARGLLFDFQAAMEQAAIANLYRQMREANWVAVVIRFGAAHARDRDCNRSRTAF